MPFIRRRISKTVWALIVALAAAGLLSGMLYRHRNHGRNSTPPRPIAAAAPAGPAVVPSAAVVSAPPAVPDESMALARRTFPDWEIAPWGHPFVRRASPGVVLEAHETAGGLLFHKSLVERSSYRLEVRGRRHGLSPVLRVKIDEFSSDYPLATGRLSVVLPRGQRIEVLLYHDRTYRFDLQSLRVVPCVKCVSDVDLKTRIVREAGVVPSDRPLALARKLRNWVADAVVLGGEPADMEQTTRTIVTMPVWQTYSEIFEPGLGGVSCGGFAAFYQKVLRLFGLPSFALDVGWDNGTKLTHVTTVLTLGGPKHRRFYIFDPTFSGEYVQGSQMVDALDLLKGTHADFQTAPMSRRVLIPHSELARFLSDNDAAQSGAVCDRESSLPEMTECHGFMDTPAYNAIMTGRAMEESGFTPGDDFILGLMKHKILGVITSDLDPDAHLEFLHRAAQLGIPIPKFYQAQ